jgi:ATP-binding protein involved in chromosome partitioning
MKQQILGVVENMSDAPCPHCGDAISLFGSGGGQEAANRLSTLVGSDVPLLASIPFSPELREGGDSGDPIVISDKNSPASRAFDTLVDKLMVRSKSLVGTPLTLHT